MSEWRVIIYHHDLQAVAASIKKVALVRDKDLAISFGYTPEIELVLKRIAFELNYEIKRGEAYNKRLNEQPFSD